MHFSPIFVLFPQKYLEMEDENQEVKKQTEEQVESLESTLRMLELKNKNASDHCE